MTTDDEDNYQPQSGQCAIKIQDEHHPDATVLRELTQTNSTLFWQIQGDRIALYDEYENRLAYVRQQWLLISGRQFVLTDLTGTL